MTKKDKPLRKCSGVINPITNPSKLGFEKTRESEKVICEISGHEWNEETSTCKNCNTIHF